jgi:hypothetical protein
VIPIGQCESAAVRRVAVGAVFADCDTMRRIGTRWERGAPVEVTTATVFLSPKQTIALEQIATRLLVRMIQDGLIDSKTETQVIVDH